MRFTSISTLLMSLIVVVIIAAIVYLFILLIRALRKYLRSGEVRQENRAAVESLAKALKGHRERCRPQHRQPAGAGQAVRRVAGGAAAQRAK